METEKASGEELSHHAREESSLENIPAGRFLWKIPDETILQFFECHDLKDQIFLSQTCKQLNNLFKEVKKEYRKKFIRHFPYLTVAAEKDVTTMECWYKKFHLAERSEYAKLGTASQKLFSLTKEGCTKLLNEHLSNQLEDLERKLKKEALESKVELTEEQLQESLRKNLLETFSYKDKQEYTILYWARQASNLDSRNSMLYCFYDLLKKYCKEEDLVYWAIQCRQPLDEIQYLLIAANPSSGLSPYKLAKWAAEAWHEEFLEYLFKENPRLGEEFIFPIEEGRRAPRSILHLAITACPFSTSFPIMDKLLTIAPALLNQASFKDGSPLYFALSRRRIDLAEYFLRQPHIDVLRSDRDGGTPLHIIARKASYFKEEKIFSLMDLLLSKNRNALNKKGDDFFGYTPLVQAIHAGQEQMVRYLLQQKDIDVVAYDNLDNTSLEAAIDPKCKRENFAIIQMLLEKKPDLLHLKHRYDGTLLFSAIKKRKPWASIEKLLYSPESEAALLDRDSYEKNTPLHAAISPYRDRRCADLGIIQALLHRKPDLLNEKNRQGRTPLFFALSYHQEEVVMHLLKHKDIDLAGDAYGDNLLHAAFIYQFSGKGLNCSIIETLIEDQPALLIGKNESGYTPLWIAISHGYKEEALYLLEQKGVDFSCDNENEGKDTLLHAALHSSSPNLAIIELLLQKMPDLLYKKNKKGIIPLVLAIMRKHAKAVEYLLEQHQENDEVFLRDNEGNTLLHVLVSNNEEQRKRERLWGFGERKVLNQKEEESYYLTLQALLHKKPKLLNQRNNKNETPLLLAISLDDDRMVNYLLMQEGIDVNNANEDGHTSLHAALDRSFVGVENRQDREDREDRAQCNQMIIKALLRKHPSLFHQKNRQGLTPLFSAIKKGFSLRKPALLLADRQMTQHDPFTREEFNDFDAEKNTLLHAAVYRWGFFHPDHLQENLAIIQEWLRMSPQLLHQKNQHGFTPLFLAIKMGHTELVKFFNGKYINTAQHLDNNGNTLLHAVLSSQEVHSPSLDIIKDLLDKNIELLRQKNAAGITPLILAIREGHGEVVKFFIERANDEKVFAPDNDGNNPLHAALLYPNKLDTQIIHELIERKPDLLYQRNGSGISPASLAMSTKSREVTEYFSAQPHANVNGMASEIQATIEFLYKKACTVRVREKTGIEILPSLECSFVTKEDAQVVFDGLNTHFRSSAETKQPILEIRENGPSTLLLSIETCHDMLQQAKEDMVKRYEELNLLLHTLHPDLKKQVEACMRKHLGVDFNIQLKNRVHSIKKIKEFHEEVQRLSLPSGLKIALTAFVMTLAVYGAFAIATSIIVAIPIAAVAIVPIGYFVRGFFNSSKYKNDKAAIKKIFEKPAMGSFSKQENCGKEREEKKEDDPPRQVM